MAAVRSKSKSKSKLQPKKAAKTKAKKSPAKKPPAKKPAKKAAPKQPAAKKPPAKKPAKKPAAKKPKVELEQADLMRMDGMKVPSKQEREATVAASQSNPRFAEVRNVILDAFRGFYPATPRESDETILGTDPNDFDVDPGPFYEFLQERFGLANDPEQDYFGGFGGKIEHTIAVVAKHWDGKLR